MLPQLSSRALGGGPRSHELVLIPEKLRGELAECGVPPGPVAGTFLPSTRDPRGLLLTPCRFRPPVSLCSAAYVSPTSEPSVTHARPSRDCCLSLENMVAGRWEWLSEDSLRVAQGLAKIPTTRRPEASCLVWRPNGSLSFVERLTVIRRWELKLSELLGTRRGQCISGSKASPTPTCLLSLTPSELPGPGFVALSPLP